MMKRLLILGWICIFCTAAGAQQFNLSALKPMPFKKDSFNIIAYGAVADGITYNTKSINDAIQACNKKGGGVVVIPSGIWLTGPIVLLSNVNLHLNKNALLQFTDDLSNYKLIETNWEGVAAVRNESPISAVNADHIAITGFGIVDGNGDAWRAVKKDKLSETQWKNLLNRGGLLSDDKKTWYPSESSMRGFKTEKPGVIGTGKTIADFAEIKDFLRPNLVVLNKCSGVLLEGVTFQNSPAWNLHPLMCKNLIVRNVYAKNPAYAQNGDGIDVESCKNVLIENSFFDVGDDGICIKSGRDAEGRKRNMPTENVIIRNCTVYHAHGGFVIGSEMSGGAKNIYVSDCTFDGTDIGLRFKTARGRGGVVEKIFVDGIIMKNIQAEAILFDMYYEAKDPVVLAGEKREEPAVEFKPVNETTPQFMDFHIKNIVCNGASKAIFIRGLPEMNIHDITLENMTLVSKKGTEISEAMNIKLKNIKVISSDPACAVDVLNSSNINFDQMTTISSAPVLLRIGGNRSAKIQWLNGSDIKQKTIFEFGASTSALIQ